MTNPNRLDPLSFAGSFAYVESDVPAGVTLAAWRARDRASSAAQAVSSTGLAPQGRTLRVRGLARRPRSGRGPNPRRNR